MPRRTGLSRLVDAARAWDAREVRELLAAAPELATRADRTGRTALHHVATQDATKRPDVPARRAVAAARALLAGDADLDAVQEIVDEGEVFPARPLWTAYARGKNQALVRFLLGEGCDPSGCLWATGWRDDVRTTRLLVRHGAPLEEVFHGDTPFLWAARMRRFAARLDAAG